jgi:hypothetical protein
LPDEEIIDANPCIDKEKFAKTPGRLTQQVVKSEFWRIGKTKSYICLDSDCVFIRPFMKSDFITENGTPYTIVDEGRDFFFPSLVKRNSDALKNFRRESEEVMKVFGRKGKNYNFGPNCPSWDQRVWKSLEVNLLTPRGISFLDLILESPNEMRWYGEALLKYKAIELHPSQPFFKMYHYAWQQQFDRRLNITDEQLKQLYCGVVYQSAWERNLDWPSEGGNAISRLGRRLRRWAGRI